LTESIRAVRQQLESLSLAGLTHLPRGKLPSSSGARAAIAAAKPSRAPVSEPASPAAGALAVLATKVRECTRCAELARTRTQTVFGVGNPQARIVFVGEAPGADEDAQGEPFVGRAGQLLNQIITASRLTRDEIYICNVLKCRPPGNRTPNDDECANCREYLEGQLAAINPEYIVCWGAVAARNLLKSPLSIGKLRGKLHEYGRAKVLCTYHPSYLLRNPAAKKDVWNDMQFLMADMGVDLKGKP
jgi:DNA polymerase